MLQQSGTLYHAVLSCQIQSLCSVQFWFHWPALKPTAKPRSSPRLTYTYNIPTSSARSAIGRWLLSDAHQELRAGISLHIFQAQAYLSMQLQQYRVCFYRTVPPPSYPRQPNRSFHTVHGRYSFWPVSFSFLSLLSFCCVLFLVVVVS